MRIAGENEMSSGIDGEKQPGETAGRSAGKSAGGIGKSWWRVIYYLLFTVYY